MQTTKQKRQTKQNFEQFSEQILPWLESALDYLDSNYWEFSVSKKGKYEPAVQLIEDPPEDFVFETEEPRGKILFRLPRQQIRTVEELANAQERVWKTVSVALIATVGVSIANQALSDLREAYGFKKVRRSAAWSMAPSHWYRGK